MSANVYERLEGDNYRSLGPVDVAFPRTGLVLIRGRNVDAAGSDSNGSGKSSFLGLFRWVLFGVADREGSAAAGVVNRHRKGPTWGQLTFLGRDGARYVVRRERARKGTVKLTATRDGQDVSATCSASTQEVVDRAVGMDSRGFFATSVFQDAFRFTDLKDKAAKEMLERVLDASDLEEALKLVRADLAKLRSDLTVAALDVTREEALEAQRRTIAETIQQRARDAEQRRAGDLSTRRSAVQMAEAALAGTPPVSPADVQAAEARVREAEVLVTGFGAQHGEARALYRAAGEAASRAASRSLQVTPGVPCPACLRPASEADVEHVRLELERARVSAEAETQRTKVAADAAASVLAQGTEVLNALRAQLAQARNGAQTRQRAEESVARSREELTRTEAGGSTSSEADARAVGDEATALAEQQARVTAARSRRDDMTRGLTEAEYVEEMLGLRGLRSMMLDEAMATLNAEASRVAARLTDGTLAVGIRSCGVNAKGQPDDKVTVDVAVSTGGEGYEECSRGERARVDLPILFALRAAAVARRGVDPGVLMLDEVLDEMDAAGVERAVPLLSELARTCLVFVVTHRPELSGVDETLTVVKRGGVSQVYRGEVTDLAVVEQLDGGGVVERDEPTQAVA